MVKSNDELIEYWAVFTDHGNDGVVGATFRLRNSSHLKALPLTISRKKPSIPTPE